MSRKEKDISQTDTKTGPRNCQNERRPDQQATTEDSGNSNTNPDSPQSEETITATTNQRDEALAGLVDGAGIGISEAVLLEVGNIDSENGTLTIDSRRERVKLSCPYCRETVSKRHRFCPACGGEITEPVREKTEKPKRQVIHLDPATLRCIREYLEWRHQFSYDGPLLFPFTRQRGWQLMKRIRKLTEIKALKQTPETDNNEPEPGIEDDDAV